MNGPTASSPVTGAGAQEAGNALRDPSVLISLLVPALIGFYLLLTSTTSPVSGILLYDAKRILQFGLLLVLFLVPALNGRIRMEFDTLLSGLPAWLSISLLCMVGWGTVSAWLNAQSPMHALNSLSEVALLSALGLGIFVVAACRRIAKTWFDRIAIALLALTGLAVGLQELIGVAAAHATGSDFNFQVSLMHFSFPRFYNQVQSWTIPVLAALPALFPRHRLAAAACVMVLGLQWYIVLMTGARGSFVSIAAASLFVLIFIPPVRARLLKWQSMGLLLGVLVFAGVTYSFETQAPASLGGPESLSSQRYLGRDADMSTREGKLLTGKSSFVEQSLGRPLAHTSGRTRMWSITVRDARAHPLFGIGPMNYVCSSAERIGHPHNFPLQIAAEWGIPVALALCALFLFLLWRVSSSVRRNAFESPQDTAFAGLLLTGVLAAALHACLSGVMVMPASQVTGLLICGTLLGMYPSGSASRPGRAGRWRFLPGVVLALFLLVLGTYELQTMNTRTEQLSNASAMWPRIWQNAKVCERYTRQNEVKN